MSPKRGLTDLYSHVVVTARVDKEGIERFGKMVQASELGDEFEVFLQARYPAVEFLEALFDSGEEAMGYAISALKIERVVRDLIYTGHSAAQQKRGYRLFDLIQRCTPEDRLEILKAEGAFEGLAWAFRIGDHDKPNTAFELLKPYAPEEQDAILNSESAVEAIRAYRLQNEVQALRDLRQPVPI